MNTINLDDEEETRESVCLIIPKLVPQPTYLKGLKSNLYQRQANGVCCNQREIAGKLINLGKSQLDIFNPQKWYLNNWKDGQVISYLMSGLQTLLKSSEHRVLKIILLDIVDIEEAWTFVSLSLDGIICDDVVLTWQNCD